MSIPIEFEPVGRRGPCLEGASLLHCARELGVDLVNLCGGAGTCGRCKVQLLTGDVSGATPSEEDLLTAAELGEGYRLACQTYPRSGCKVSVPSESLSAPQRTQVEGVAVQVALDPPVRPYAVWLPEASLEDLRADAERLRDSLLDQRGIDASAVDVAVLGQLSACLRTSAWQVRAAVRGHEIVAVLPDRPDHGLPGVEGRPAAPLLPGARSTASPRSAALLGLAVDLGTTKIAGYLLDLESGATLASLGLMNPQISYGEDVIARMSYASDSPAQAASLQAVVVEALDEMVAELCASAGAEPSEIVEVVVVGNTAMHHLLLRLPVEQLSLAPYVPAVCSALDVRARELGLHLAPGAFVHLLPNIAGYVGADHIAMLLATGVGDRPGVVLALDIGTNTEVCLAEGGHLTSLSCASGPAFEGAHIRHGMRAADGAIEHFRLLGDRVEYQTIGGVPPVGLCGSGILDALAQLHMAGLVDARGRMQEHPRIRESGGVREFVIADTAETDIDRPAITFTQRDVRELQLAKGAMRTGIQVLLETAGRHEDEIDQVIIAGAFGTYIDVASAIAVGMLPPLPLDRFQQVGNAAGMGAKLALISEERRAAAQALARRVGYIELATAPQFARTFAQSMLLGTDLFR